MEFLVALLKFVVTFFTTQLNGFITDWILGLF